jgi:hypothetical protein
MLLPFSLRAKQAFLASSLLNNSLKAALSVVETRIVREVKDKKKKVKVHTLQAEEEQVLEEMFSLLSALFYWNGDGKIDGA